MKSIPAINAASADNVSEVLRAGGHGVELTNPGKMFFPARGITKRGLSDYYAAVSRVLLPHLRNRALAMKRYRNGSLII